MLGTPAVVAVAQRTGPKQQVKKEIKRNLKNILRQMKMEIQDTKFMKCGK